MRHSTAKLSLFLNPNYVFVYSEVFVSVYVVSENEDHMIGTGRGRVPTEPPVRQSE